MEAIIVKSSGFSRRIRNLSKEYSLPLEICFVLGDDKDIYEDFIPILSKKLPKKEIRDLFSGYNSKESLLKVLGEDLYDDMRISKLDKKQRISMARFIAGRCK
jgi:hypothetical protein